jgi:hypothetical protein
MVLVGLFILLCSEDLHLENVWKMMMMKDTKVTMAIMMVVIIMS